MRRLLAVVFGTAGCLPGNPPGADGLETESDESGDTGPIEDGLLGCPSGETCTLVIVSQTIDDRVEVYSAAGPGPTYRGAIDVDLKPNPGGSIAGLNLDEPYGLGFHDQTLHVLLGHYPTREQGSLVSLPAAGFGEWGNGELIPSSVWFDGNAAIGGSTLVQLEREEPLSLVIRRGAIHVGVFANDLFVPEDQWTNPSELLVVDPSSATIDASDLGCAGAWAIAVLDDLGDRLAFACDGDEGVVIVEGTADEALAPVCTGDIPFSGKRVRTLAADGSGGVLVAEQPNIVSGTETARLWWFAGDCDLRGFTELVAPTSWDVRQLAMLPSDVGPRWLLARGDGDERGVLVFSGDPASGSVSECGRLSALDDEGAWLAEGGDQPLRPHALAVSADGSAIAIGAGPAAYSDAAAGWGKVLWVELGAVDDPTDPCDAVVDQWTDLSASAPAVDPMVPQTWRRAPDVVLIAEIAG